MTEIWTIAKMLDWCAEYFRFKDITSARLDAELLLAHVLNLPRLQLYMQFDRPLTAGELATFKEFVKRRSRFEPVAYITGKKEFWSREFLVKTGVLVPRPDTEVLIEAILEQLKLRSNTELTGFEMGTGSGAIAVTLLAELPHLKMTAVENSPVACEVTLANAGKHGVAVRLNLINTDFTEYSQLSTHDSSLKIDFIISNPPYVAEHEFAMLPLDVRDHEPAAALLGGVDGLDYYRLLAPFARRVLAIGGFIAVEIGETQGLAVSEIFIDAGLSEITVKKDYAGMDRVVVAKRE